MSNFRQFRGLHRIDFANELGPQGRNVTVVFGENGRGKTGVFRAIMFCLFGDQRLSQDGDVPLRELQLVNASALRDCEKVPVEAFVELEFSHRTHRYVLKRSVRGIRDGYEVIEELDTVSLYDTDEAGNTLLENPANIERVVGSVLDKRVKDYFLFDGEKIELLTRASVEQRKDIARGIKNLLNVDALDAARKALSKLTSALETELSRTASPELARLLHQLGTNEKEQKQLEQRDDELGEEQARAQIELKKVDQELAAFEEIRGLVEERRALEEFIRTLEQRREESLSEFRILSVKAAYLTVGGTISRVFHHIEMRKNQGEIPSEIRRDLIEKILAEHTCICGREVVEGTTEHQRIDDWLHRTDDMRVQDAALNLWRHLSDLEGHLTDEYGRIERHLIKYAELRKEIDTAQFKIDAVCEKIGASERKDVTYLDAHRSSINERILKLEVEALSIQNRLVELSTEASQLKAQLKEEKRRGHLHSELSRRASLARETHEALNQVHHEFTTEIKVVLGVSATRLFHQLLDEEGRNILKQIFVDENYSLQVTDRWNRPFLANISAGQRQIMSIAFIAALAQAASKTGLLEMPLFMDTPFGRLDKQHRENLISTLPGIASQWILLATDTEFRQEEAKLLRRSGRWGRFYMLRRGADGNSSIEERDVDAAATVLMSSEAIQ
jgi:DNA sulfur modification protein DndD